MYVFCVNGIAVLQMGTLRARKVKIRELAIAGVEEMILNVSKLCPGSWRKGNRGDRD